MLGLAEQIHTYTVFTGDYREQGVWENCSHPMQITIYHCGAEITRFRKPIIGDF